MPTAKQMQCNQIPLTVIEAAEGLKVIHGLRADNLARSY